MKSPKDMRIIQIDITNACMYRCSNCTRFCGHHKSNFFMNYDTFTRAVDSLIGYHGTIGIMGGEPTLHPEFERFVKYLASILPEEYRRDHDALIRPQKDFIESILLENKINSEIYDYSTGQRETVVGAGLWSAMVPSYKKHYELIQDVFKMQAVNDHGNIMYHSPILINRRDLNIPDEEWYEIRDNCWAQDVWSATITPKGAFFCEIAGALDMLFNGPGGWPIEPGWWKRTPEEFGDQIRWCEYCGIAIETFSRNANDWIDDVSESMYKKLKEAGSPKLKKPGAINLVKIENGTILEESIQGAKEVRKELFYDSFSSRFNDEKSILFPTGFSVILETGYCGKENLVQWMDTEAELFSQIILIVPDENTALSIKELNIGESFVIQIADKIWGRTFALALEKCSKSDPVFYSNTIKRIDHELLKDLMTTVINPGTLHVRYEKDKENTCLLLFNRMASSLKELGFDRLVSLHSYNELILNWKQNKIVDMIDNFIEDTSGMRIKPGKRYILYGAGNTGVSALNQVKASGSDVIAFSDSDSAKWGCTIEDVPVIQPAELKSRRDEYDEIIISCTFFKEVYSSLLAMGFSNGEIIIYE